MGQYSCKKKSRHVIGVARTGSIISKKAAEGISSLVLDVKTGSGAFMEKFEDAKHLAELMVSRNRRAIGVMVTSSVIVQQARQTGSLCCQSVKSKYFIDP